MKFRKLIEYRLDNLWYFVAFGLGIAVYFGLPFTIVWWIGLILLSVFAIATFFQKSSWLKIGLFFALGLLIVSVRTSFIHTEFLQYPHWNQLVEGTVTSAFSTYKGQVIVLEELKAEHMVFIPKRVRISFNETSPQFTVGDVVQFKGHLYPPQAMQRRRFFYQGIAAQGKITHILAHKRVKPNFINGIRSAIINRLQTHLNPQQLQIAIPLIVGEQQMVPPDLYAVYRKAGIAHVLSVSGFHMVLLAGFVFFLIRGLLSCVPFLALRISAKKIAAVVAFLITGFYLFISGAQIPALRAFFMITLVFLGILTNRKTFSLYTLFLVGFCLLCVHPEWITSVSFQLSFFAVMILVGLFEEMSKYLNHIRFCRVFGTSILANILISLGLAPFIVYHFNELNPYGVLGNLLTSLLFSLWVMPSLFVGVLTIPIDGDELFFKIAGLGIELITKLANYVADLPGAEILLPAFSPLGLGIVAFGLSFLCIVKSCIRWGGLVMMMLGLAVGYMTQCKPDIIVGEKGRIILVRQENEFVVKGDLNHWFVKKWLKKNGQTQAKKFGDTLFYKDGHTIAFDAAMCTNANMLIGSQKSVRCQGKDVLYPKRGKTYFVYILKDKVHIELEDEIDLNRPWGIQQNVKERK